jgi:CheY-like chemotaxis protein
MMSENRFCPKVLVVDDDHTIADTLAVILNKSGFKAFAAYSGEMAFEVAKTLKPDVLISDVFMGGMSGIDAAILISESLPHCKVILFSGNATTANLLEKSEVQGYCFEVLSKPVHPKVLIDRLAALTS